MGIWLLSPLLLAGLGLAMRPALRRVFGAEVSTAAPAGAGPEVPMPEASGEAPSEIAPEAPCEAPPAASASAPPAALQVVQTEPLGRAEVFARLRQLELGVGELARLLPEHEPIMTAAIAAIGDPAAQRRYFPRRPNLLPQLMHAITDENVARRKLVGIIARDPSLVGSLLKMANSPLYRVTQQPVESIERAVVILGSDGLRSLVTVALMQPIFQGSVAGDFPRFPELVWEHAMRSGHAAIPHAALVEKIDPFTAELLSLVSGLAEIVLFRAAADHCAAAPPQERSVALVIASLLESQSAALAWRIAIDWQLSEPALAALEEQTGMGEPRTALGRTLRFSRLAGALAVLHDNEVIDEATVRQSLPKTGLSASHLETLLRRLLHRPEDPRTASQSAPRNLPRHQSEDAGRRFG